MNALDRLLQRVHARNDGNKLKSEEIFDDYVAAKKKLAQETASLTKIIDLLSQEQIDGLNFKDFNKR